MTLKCYKENNYRVKINFSLILFLVNFELSLKVVQMLLQIKAIDAFTQLRY